MFLVGVAAVSHITLVVVTANLMAVSARESKVHADDVCSPLFL